jgi:hypothetical protein
MTPSLPHDVPHPHHAVSSCCWIVRENGMCPYLPCSGVPVGREAGGEGGGLAGITPLRS